MPSHHSSRSRDAWMLDSSHAHQFHSSVQPSANPAYRVTQASAVHAQRRTGHPRWAAMLSMGLLIGCLVWLLS